MTLNMKQHFFCPKNLLNKKNVSENKETIHEEIVTNAEKSNSKFWDDILQQNCVKLISEIMSPELDLWGFARERYPP